MMLTRTETRPEHSPCELHTLTTKQRRILEAIDAYWRATGDACPCAVLAHRFALNPTTVRKHLEALHRKGWLRTSNSPAHLVDFVQPPPV